MQFGACWFWCCWFMVLHHVKAAVTTSSNRCDLTAKMCQELSYTDSMFKEQCYSLKSDVDVNTPPIIGDCASICHDDVDSKHRCRSLCQGLCLCVCVYVYVCMCIWKYFKNIVTAIFDGNTSIAINTTNSCRFHN